jgi:hypothetical protein
MLQLPKQIGHIKTEIPIKIFVLMTFLFLILGFVANAQAPPTDIVLNKDNIDEHCPVGTLIGNFSAVDADGGTHFWTLVAGAGASGNMSFDIPIGSSSLLSDEIFNYESQTTYSIQVQVKDENNATFSKSFTININDIDENDLQTFTVLSSSDIDEGNDIGDAVGTLSTTGVHSGTNHSYTFVTGSGSTDNGSFSINGDQLLAAEVFDYDTKDDYSIRVRSESEENDVHVQVLLITVNQVNNVPTDITLTDNSFEETQSVGYRVGFLNTEDLDEGESYTYSFVEGEGDDDNENFSISFSSFKLATTYDFETKPTHSVRIQTDDGNGGLFEKVLTINVEDDPEAVSDIFLTNSSIDEENNIGDAIGTLSSEDDDTEDVHTYELKVIGGSTDHTAFSIDGDVLKAAVEFDFETQSSYTIRITSNDGTGYFLNKDFVITINDVVEPIIWDGAEWSNGVGPTFADNVIIDGDYDVETEGTFPSNDLTINSGSGLVIDGNSTLTVIGDILVNGGITVHSGSSLLTYEGNQFIGFAFFRRTTRYGNGKYSIVGTPTTQNNSNTADNFGDNVYYYDETIPFGADGINRWIPVTTEQLVPGRGYTQAHLQNIFFIGKPNTGTITVNGTYTEDTEDANEGWNLIANPYAAAIDVEEFLTENTNIAGAVYLWDDNGSNSERGTNADYIVANGTMATNVTDAGGQTRYNQAIGSTQGFFVKLNSAADMDIEFTESMREVGKNSDENFFRKDEFPIIRLNLKDDNGLFKQTVIGFAEDAYEDQINRRYDAPSFNSESEYGIFTLKGGHSLSLNGMPSIWGVIQLQVNTKESGTFQLSVEIENYSQPIYLRDNLSGEVVDLRNGAYSFASHSDINTGRFELISNPSEVLGLEQNEVLIYALEHTLHIQQKDEIMREYQLFNMNGKHLITANVNGRSELNLNTLPSGIYLVFDGIKTHKIILK